MAFAWCMFFGSKWAIAGFPSLNEDQMLLQVILAISCSIASYCAMWVLDKIADLPDEYTPPWVDAGIRQVIFAISILIGFAWEQCFDEATGALSRQFKESIGEEGPVSPAVVRFLLSIFCFII